MLESLWMKFILAVFLVLIVGRWGGRFVSMLIEEWNKNKKDRHDSRDGFNNLVKTKIQEMGGAIKQASSTNEEREKHGRRSIATRKEFWERVCDSYEVAGKDDVALWVYHAHRGNSIELEPLKQRLENSLAVSLSDNSLALWIKEIFLIERIWEDHLKGQTADFYTTIKNKVICELMIKEAGVGHGAFLSHQWGEFESSLVCKAIEVFVFEMNGKNVGNLEDLTHSSSERLKQLPVQTVKLFIKTIMEKQRGDTIVSGVQKKIDLLGAKKNKKNDDVYQTLGIEPGDSTSIIKRQYKKLVLKYHPDRWGNQSVSPRDAQVLKEKFLLIQQAYERIKIIRTKNKKSKI